MSDPWDSPPFPRRGNRSSRVLYEAIGRALITWEEFEITLASLYAALCGKSRFDSAAGAAYGIPWNFKDRIAALKSAGCLYFIKRPDQNLEGKLAQITDCAIGYSRYRNDIAHGVVRAIRLIRDPQAGILLASLAPEEYCLVPPDFREDKYINSTLPAYILSSREINRFTNALWPMANRAYSLAGAVELPQHASRRKFFVPPPPLGSAE